ncbi:MAG: hypothetical protein LM514_05720 [Streptococcus sp.]|nr:hypothetical protein [Streptococcus sp.]
MIRNFWTLFGAIALIFGVRGALAGEAWLIITSDLPGTMISVDNTYRGITPQRPGDALRVTVSEGIRQIQARKQVDGKEYAAQQNVEVIGHQQIPVQFNLREQNDSPAITGSTPDWYPGSPGVRPTFPLGEMEVPGKNF